MNTTLTMNFLDKRAKLSSLWAFVFFSFIFRDLHEFGRAGFLEQMLTGVVNGVQITDGLLLIGGFMIAIPLLVLPLTQFLKFRANRLTNLIMAVVTILLVVGNNLAPDLDDVFFAVLESAALLLILQQAWVWTDRAA